MLHVRRVKNIPSFIFIYSSRTKLQFSFLVRTEEGSLARHHAKIKDLNTRPSNVGEIVFGESQLFSKTF